MDSKGIVRLLIEAWGKSALSRFFTSRRGSSHFATPGVRPGNEPVRPPTLPRRVVIWLIPILLTLHNAEEAIAFRHYLPTIPSLLPAPFASLTARLPYAALAQALIGLSLLAFALAFLANARPQSQQLFWLLLALQATVGLNVLAHVVTAAFVFSGYGPGLATALAVNAPFTAYCFRRATRDQWVSSRALRATVPAAFVLHGPVLVAALCLAGRLARF